MRLFTTIRRRWLSGTALGAALSLALAVHALAAEEEADEANEDAEVTEPDYVNDAARLLHDGHHERALRVLSEVDPNDPKVDRKRFHTLRGLAHVALEHHAEAKVDFEAAIAAGETNPGMQLSLAQACFHVEDFGCVLEALSKGGNEAKKNPSALLMRAESQWRLGEKQQGERSMRYKADAIATLEQGSRAFPDKPEFERIRIFYLIELQLYAEAAAVSRRYLERVSATEEDYIAIGEALRTARDHRGAQLLLEGARLRYPDSEKIVVQLAHAYLDAGQKIASAMLFEEAALLEPKYAFESAELYKEGGQTYRATWMNARVADQSAKTKQRLSLLVDAEDFEAVSALEPKLSRLGLMSDQNVRYAVAYAAFKTGQYGSAEQHLRHVTQPELLDSALQLRKAVETCREAGWECAL